MSLLVSIRGLCGRAATGLLAAPRRPLFADSHFVQAVVCAGRRGVASRGGGAGTSWSTAHKGGEDDEHEGGTRAAGAQGGDVAGTDGRETSRSRRQARRRLAGVSRAGAGAPLLRRARSSGASVVAQGGEDARSEPSPQSGVSGAGRGESEAAEEQLSASALEEEEGERPPSGSAASWRNPFARACVRAGALLCACVLHTGMLLQPRLRTRLVFPQYRRRP